MDGEVPSLPAQSSGSGNSGSSGGSSQRKERGAIAAQACDTCRGRKQRCDEQRPKCGTCLKFNLECNYREPLPTKKDKTLVEILDRIKTLEGKIDSLGLPNAAVPSTTYATTQASILPLGTTQAAVGAGIISPLPSTTFQLADGIGPPSGHYKYGSSVNQMLAWPVIQRLLDSIRAKVPGLSPLSIERDGQAIFLGLHSHASSLPLDITGSLGVPEASDLGLHIGAPGPSIGMPLNAPSVELDAMLRLSKAYFDSFNCIYPILDRQTFLDEILSPIRREGFNEGMASTIAFLVFALGEVAIAGTQGSPLNMFNGRASGVKGGSGAQPPGLGLFNEARKRMGFNLTSCNIENVQIFTLASVYYGTCFHHAEYWRMTMSASLACQALITSNPNELSSPRSDLLRRAFWHCSIAETFLNLELGLPLSGLEKLEAIVPTPDFIGPYRQDPFVGNQASQSQEHLSSQIILRRLLVDLNATLGQTPLTPTTLAAISIAFPAMAPIVSASPQNPITHTVMKQIGLQLEQWRETLPTYMRWREDHPTAYPNPSPDVFGSPTVFDTPTSISSPSVQAGQQSFMFTTDLNSHPVTYIYALDVQVALLRTRYYHARYLTHRPFVYKALHYPEHMSNDDYAGAAECLKACLKWPVTMSPTSAHKRLIPTMFLWSQNLLGILILLRLSQTVPVLNRIRTTLCGERFEMEAGETVALYIDWLRDLQEVDPAAEWSWRVAKAIYALDE